MTPDAPSFDHTISELDGVEGWLTDAQARRLWDSAEAAGAHARIVEIGSYRGRSAIVMARASAPGTTVVAIDPHAGNDRGPQEIHGTSDEGEADNQAFRANLAAAGVTERVRHVRRPSQDALDEVAGPLDVLYIDGAHRYGPAAQDIARWGTRVAPGGTLLIHDSYSSIGVTLALIRHLFFNDQFVYIGRTTSLAQYRRTRRGRLSAPARVRNALHQLGDVPWFIRNVAIKVAIVAKQPWLARIIARGPAEWPY